MRIVATQAGITATAIYRHFASKEALLAHGHEVLVLDNLSTGSIDNIARDAGVLRLRQTARLQIARLPVLTQDDIFEIRTRRDNRRRLARLIDSFQPVTE